MRSVAGAAYPTRLIVVAAISFAAMAANVFGQVRVTKSPGEASFLDLSGLRCDADDAATSFRRTLEADLVRSGWFNLSGGGRAEYAVLGSVSSDGRELRIQCEAYNAMSRERHLQKSYRCETRQFRSTAHRVADDLTLALTGRPGMASSRIVMVGNRTGKKELYICDTDGANLRQLTRDNVISLSPHWSPDGAKIAYTSFHRASFPDVYLIEIASGNRRCVSDFPGLNASAAFSPDGNTLALILSKEGNPDLFAMDLRSERVTRLTATKRAAEACPAWAPDGRQICFVSDSPGTPQLFIIEREGGQPRRLALGGAQNVDPDWGPGGYIAYSSLIGGQYAVWVVNPSTGEHRQVSRDDANYEDPAWAPDGRHIFCVRRQNYLSRIFIIDTLSSSCISLLPETEKGDWFAPDCSGKFKTSR